MKTKPLTFLLSLNKTARKNALTLIIFILFLYFPFIATAFDEKDLIKFKSTNECESCDLSNGDFLDYDMTGANLKGTNLSGAFLRFSNLSNADLRDANLSNANLIMANLSNADLRGSTISGAILTGAYLYGANLSGVDVSKVDLSVAVLEVDPKKQLVVMGVDDVLNALKIESDLESRRLMLVALGEFGDSRATPILINHLTDKNSNIKNSAIAALGEIGGSVAITSLAGFLQDDNVETQLSAIHALSKIGDSTAIRILVENLTGKKIIKAYKNNSISANQDKKIEVTIASLEEKMNHPDRSMAIDLDLILYLHAFRAPSDRINSKIESIKKIIGTFLDNEVYSFYVDQRLPEKVYATPYDGTDHSLIPLIQWVSSAVDAVIEPTTSSESYRIPCVVIKKKPGLLDAIDPLFATSASGLFILSGCKDNDLNEFPAGLLSEYEDFSNMLDGDFLDRYEGSARHYIFRSRAPLRASMPFFIDSNNDLSKMGLGDFRFPYETWSYMSLHNRKHFEEIGLRFSILKCLLAVYYMESFGSSIENAFKSAGKKLFDLTLGAYCGEGRPRFSLRTLLIEGAPLSSIKSFVKHNPEHNNGRHIEDCENYSGINPLIHIAVRDVTSLKFLWELSAESGGFFKKGIDSPNVFNKTVLMTAVQLNFLESVKFLIKNGANVNAITDSKEAGLKLLHDGRTPLMYAAANSSLEIIQLLLMKGADPNVIDTQGYKALDYLLGLESIGINTSISEKDTSLARNLLESVTKN